MSDRLTRLRAKMAERRPRRASSSARRWRTSSTPTPPTGATSPASPAPWAGCSSPTTTQFIAVDFRYFEQAEQRVRRDFTLFPTTGGIEKWFADAGRARPALAGKKHRLRAGRRLRRSRLPGDEARRSTRCPRPTGPKLLAAPPLDRASCARSRSRARSTPLQRAVDLGDAAFDARRRSASSRAGRRSRSPGRSRSTPASTAPSSSPSRRSSPPARTARCRTPSRATTRSRRATRSSSTWACIVDGYCSDLTRTIVCGGEAGTQVPRDLRHRPDGAAHRRGADPHRHGRRRGAHAGAQRHRGGGLRRELRPRPRPRRRPAGARGAAPGQDVEGRAEGRHDRHRRAGHLPHRLGAACASRTMCVFENGKRG